MVRVNSIRRSLLLAATVCALASQPVLATCPTTKSSSVIGTGAGDCVIRASSSTVGDYILLCANSAGTLVDVRRFHPNHTLLQFLQLNALVNKNVFGTEAVDVGGTGLVRWVTGWAGKKNTTDPTFSWNRRFDSVFGNWSTENTVIDPIGTEKMYPPHSMSILPQSRRIVTSIKYEYTLSNSCYAPYHHENRAVFNLRDSGYNTLINKQLVSSFCSFDPAHQGPQGHGQEYPDVSASWLLSDYFVVSWFERGQGSDKVYARVFDYTGTAITTDILVDDAVNPGGAEILIAPRVGATPAGFMVVWPRSDQRLWMRTFNIQGTPYSAAQRVSPTLNLPVGANPDIDTAFVDVCGGGAEVFFAVSWWARTGTNQWKPQVTVLRGIANPVNLGSNGYFALTSTSQSGDEAITDRVSLTFFNKVNLSDSACDDLTLGAGWTVTSSGVSNIRTQFIRWVPSCQSAMSGAAESLELTGADASELASCVAPDCVVFSGGERPAHEPALLFPSTGQW